MTQTCSLAPTSDALQGAVFALEGVEGAVTVLNGPTGCKYYHSSVADAQLLQQSEFDPFNELERWFFGQPRVPCTYLDGRDYVVGSKEKLTSLLQRLAGMPNVSLISVVNSPGAALIGDDLAQLADAVLVNKPHVVIESPGFSTDMTSGYETAALETLRQLVSVKAPDLVPQSVNLLGLSVFHKYFKGDVAELARLLGLCGVKVNCALFAGCSVDDIRNIGAAELNVVVHPEFAARTAEFIENEYGVPTLIPPTPIGFAATEQFVAAICERLGVPQSARTGFDADMRAARARAYKHISRVNSLTGLPKGVPYAVRGTWSELTAWVGFLTSYFGMVPVALEALSAQLDAGRAELKQLLDKFGASDALELPIVESDAELVFADANTIAALRLAKRQFTGVEISLPSLGYLHVIPKAQLGTQGALLITEQVLNGLLFD